MPTTRQGCDRVQLSVPSDLLRRIDLDAFDKQQPRAHWLIDAAEGHLRVHEPLVFPQGPQVYAAAVEAAAKASGGLSRTLLEAVVAAVILSLKASQEEA